MNGVRVVQMTAGIRNQHLDQFLPQRRKPAAAPTDSKKPELDFLHCPIVDLGIPTEEQCAPFSGSLLLQAKNQPNWFTRLVFGWEDGGLTPSLMDRVRQLISDLEARLTRGEVLYIHCWGGRGRAGWKVYSVVWKCLILFAYH